MFARAPKVILQGDELAVLVDLTVLNLFDEYWDYVSIGPFTISLLAAILLQFLLQVTIVIEHRVAGYIKTKSALRTKVLRFLSAWAIIFVSKVVMLEAINFLFGDRVLFGGPSSRVGVVYHRADCYYRR